MTTAGDAEPARPLRAAVEECRAGTASSDRSTQLFETETAVCFIGRFERGIDEAVKKLIKDDRKMVVVKSVGGSGLDAASIGLHILEKRADVAVFDVCFSACANYIFLAGRRKYLAADALLAWHGAPPRGLTARERVLDTSGRLAMTRHRSEQFFLAAGVDRRLASESDVTSPIMSSGACVRIRRPSSGGLGREPPWSSASA